MAAMTEKRIPATVNFDGLIPYTHECGCAETGLLPFYSFLRKRRGAEKKGSSGDFFMNSNPYFSLNLPYL